VGRRRKNVNPYPAIISDRVWQLLHKWAEWRSCKGTARAARMPEETGRWRMRAGRLVYEPAICLQPTSTKPPEPGVMEIFNQCMVDIGEPHRVCLVAVVERQAQPWLKGEAWESLFQRLGMSKKDFRRRLRAALEALGANAGQKGLY